MHIYIYILIYTYCLYTYIHTHIHTNIPGVHAAQGEFLRHTKNSLAEAETCYMRALELVPAHTSALRGMGMIKWEAKGDIQGAEEMFKAALDAEPAHPKTLTKCVCLG